MNVFKKLFAKETISAEVSKPDVSISIANNIKVITGGRRNWSNFKPFETNADDDKYLRLTHSMMSSDAWRSLSIYSRYLYVELKAKYNGSNENDISFTYREGAVLMNKTTFTKAMDLLVSTGFIKLLEQNTVSRKCNIYGFSEMWKLFGAKDFHVELRRKRTQVINGQI